MSYEFFLSWRYLKAKRKQTFISIITWISIGGVAIGVTALIVVLAVMTGAHDDMRRKVLGANSHAIVSHAMSYGISDVDHVLKTVRSVDGVVAASPFVFNQVMLTSPTRVTGVVLRGIKVDDVKKPTELASYMTDGDMEQLKDKYIQVTVEPDDLGVDVEMRRPGIIVGNELAFNLRIGLGDPVTVVSPTGRATPIGVAPTSREFYVVGIFNSGMYEYDSSLALIALNQAQSLFNMGNKVSGVEVRVADIYDAPKIARAIDKKLGYPYITRDWREMNKNLFFALQLEKTALGIILALIICVAAFNIVSTLIMVVMEKSKDIAILKAMGASSRSIMRIFFLEGCIIGFSGTAIGVVGGIVMCELLKKYQFIKLPESVYNLDRLPVSMHASDIVMVSVAALVLTILATIYPSWSASRQDPAESLQYE